MKTIKHKSILQEIIFHNSSTLTRHLLHTCVEYVPHLCGRNVTKVWNKHHINTTQTELSLTKKCVENT